jgi:DNA-binding transcriptional ArsR family regulator
MKEHKEIPSHKRPSWVPKGQMSEEELCPDCFKVVGVRSRYKLVCELGRKNDGASVTELTDMLGLKQPTVTHHLNTLKSVGAVTVVDRGRERIYRLDRGAHCFDECQIPFD